MSCRANAASQRQISGATKPRRTHHPWKGSRRYHFGRDLQLLENAALTRCPVAGAKSLNFHRLEEM